MKMISAMELKIGDWFTHNGKGYIYRVIKIENNCIRSKRYDEETKTFLPPNVDIEGYKTFFDSDDIVLMNNIKLKNQWDEELKDLLNETA